MDENYEDYFDGIPSEIRAMTIEELEAAIQEETKRIELLNK